MASKNPAIVVYFNLVEDASDRRGNTAQPTNNRADSMTIKLMVNALSLNGKWKMLKPSEPGIHDIHCAARRELAAFMTLEQ